MRTKVERRFPKIGSSLLESASGCFILIDAISDAGDRSDFLFFAFFTDQTGTHLVIDENFLLV